MSQLDNYHFSFTALRGVQAGRSFYTIMCPLKLVPRILVFDEEELDPQLRAQRIINRTRVPEIARYLLDNPREYVFSSLTTSVDTRVEFEPLTDSNKDIGVLRIPMTAKFLVNDGQHRRAAIEEALKDRPELGEETISIVIFIDAGLKRSQQMFADLNKHAIRPTKSLGILYDHRDPIAELARSLAETNPVFKGLTEMEKSSISNRSKKLFTLSSIYQATQTLLALSRKGDIHPEQEALAHEFWQEAGSHISDWSLAKKGKVSSAELRRDYVHAHGVALQALAIAGAALLCECPNDWKERLKKLEAVDWSRQNGQAWEGRALVAGRINKTHNHVCLAANYLKSILGMSLTEDERRLESQFSRGRIGGDQIEAA